MHINSGGEKKNYFLVLIDKFMNIYSLSKEGRMVVNNASRLASNLITSRSISLVF